MVLSGLNNNGTNATPFGSIKGATVQGYRLWVFCLPRACCSVTPDWSAMRPLLLSSISSTAQCMSESGPFASCREDQAFPTDSRATAVAAVPLVSEGKRSYFPVSKQATD